MNKAAIKSFSIWARNKLIADITYKAGLLGITEEGIKDALPQSTKEAEFYDIGAKEPHQITGEEIKQRKQLADIIRRKTQDLEYRESYRNVIEEVAYTWFNRLIAIRFMEVNDYMPAHVRVLSSERGMKLEPDIVTTPFEAELEFTSEEEQRILKLKNDNAVDELFRFLFIRQCNALSRYLPKLFEKTADYTELLLNVSVTDQDGIVYHLVHDIEEKDFNMIEGGQVEIIGWMYQYYNTELKDEAFALLKKNVKISKERIPAATQLFTPDWIVRYMVENSLGRLWLEGHPDDSLKKQWKYYLDEAEQEPDVAAQLEEIRKDYQNIKPEDIKIIDPCMGSGHILVYAFDVLMQIYESYGYSQRDAAKSIVENNLYGLDIDDRAFQLAYFAVMMKARQYNRRILTQDIEYHIFAIEESNKINRMHLQYFGRNFEIKERNNAIEQFKILLDKFADAKEYGSMLVLDEFNGDRLRFFLNDMADRGQMSLETIGISETRDNLFQLLAIAQILSKKYHVVVTNPPYMSNRNMGKKLATYIHKNYTDSKNDTFAVFIEVASKLVRNHGFYSMITQPSIISLSAFRKLRYRIINEQNIVSLIHMGRGIFGIDFGSTAFVIRKSIIRDYISIFLKLYNRTFQYIAPEDIKKIFLSVLEDHDYIFDFASYKADNTQGLVTEEEDIFSQSNNKIYYSMTSRDFLKIPDNSFAYWMAPTLINAFSNTKIADYATVTNGLFTCDNNRFLRLWHEVNVNNIYFECDSKESNLSDNRRWYPYNKGGNYRKWYGNHEYIVDFKNFGKDISDFRVKSGQSASFPGQDYYFKESLSWSFISAAKFGIRYYPIGFIFDIAGSSVFVNNPKELYSALAFLGSEVAVYALQIMNPTMNYQAGNVRQLPISKNILQNEELCNLGERNVALAKADWDDFEVSWNFRKHPLSSNRKYLKDAFDDWKDISNERYEEMKFNENRINQIIVAAYELSEYINCCPVEKYITIRKADLTKDIKGLLSYAVGCMFGRYSLKKEGLMFAGGSMEDIYQIHSGKLDGSFSLNGTFPMDGKTYYYLDGDDYLISGSNIIPITDEEYLEDDIVRLLCVWLKKAYGEETLEENLDFIAVALGNKGNTSREIIRNYFLNEFFKDHCATYSVTGSGKRPIYWLFDSGKQSGFKALIYMHRYNADTIGNLRVDYLHRMERIYESEINRMQDTVDNSTVAREVTAATKRKEKLQKQLKECREYDEKIGHLALSRIKIDLDDGVKVNYEKVQTANDGKKYQVLAKI